MPMSELYWCRLCREEAHKREIEDKESFIKSSSQNARAYSLRVMKAVEHYTRVVEDDMAGGTRSFSDEDLKFVLMMRDSITTMFTTLQGMRDQLTRIVSIRKA